MRKVYKIFTNLYSVIFGGGVVSNFAVIFLLILSIGLTLFGFYETIILTFHSNIQNFIINVLDNLFLIGFSAIIVFSYLRRRFSELVSNLRNLEHKKRVKTLLTVLIVAYILSEFIEPYFYILIESTFVKERAIDLIIGIVAGVMAASIRDDVAREAVFEKHNVERNDEKLEQEKRVLESANVSVAASKEAIKVLKKLSDDSHAESQYYLGTVYRDGKGHIQKDIKKAQSQFEKAAKQGYKDAVEELNMMRGFDVKKEKVEFKAAESIYVQEVEEIDNLEPIYEFAEEGRADAQFELGAMCENGLDMPQNYEEAVKWYSKSARQGYVPAQYNLGFMYADGRGVAQDYEEAFIWWRKAAEQGYADAQYNLGVMYATGQGVSVDYAEASKWWRVAAKNGNIDAQNNLGIVYQEGLGVAKNYKETVKWLRKAGEQGHPKAQFNIAKMYYKGQGVNEDYEEAAKWYRMAAKQGYADAQNNLGWMYHKGIGVEQNHNKAFELYKDSAEQGNIDAQNNLAWMYHKGLGIPQNYEEAVEWYMKVAKQGDARGQHSLAVMYYKGQGAPINFIKSYMWASIAVANGNEESKELLNYIVKEMPTEDIAEAQRLATHCWESDFEDCPE